MKNTEISKTWFDKLAKNEPLIIAGPCSAETEEQVLNIAHAVKDTAKVYRAGIWKPRTRPGYFEGIGAPGLKWLQKVKEETGMLVATEVASAQHVDLVLRHDIDILWIGARSTVSPFVVQEIAEALRGTDKPILIKNPVNPDLALWLGAVERLYSCDIRNLGVIHRGFSTCERTGYRNSPEWQIAIELQSKFPNLPLILDPSHIAGRRDMIGDLCQMSLDLNYDGFIIETHNDPDNAWSDAAQQVEPETLANIVRNVKAREKTNDRSEFKSQIKNLRKKIDLYDDQLLNVMAKRLAQVDEIGYLKKENNVAILQTERWDEILDKMRLVGTELGLSQEFINIFVRAMHQESIDRQERIFKN
jgi:chorismate mutase